MALLVDIADCNMDYPPPVGGFISVDPSKTMRYTHGKPRKNQKMKLVKIMALTVLLGTALATSVKAQSNLPVLLYVDVSDPHNVIFTATPSFAFANDSSTLVGDGVDLLNFFPTALLGGGGFTTGNLVGGDSGIAYTAFAVDDDSTSGGDYVDLNLYDDPGNSLQTFSTNAAAFTGSTTIDYNSLVGELPEEGDHGSIIAGWDGNPGQVIGEWVVGAAPVPEPGTMALAGLGGLSALIYARRRK